MCIINDDRPTFYLCGTCKGTVTGDDGECIEGHDDWLELRDVAYNPSSIVKSAEWLGIPEMELIQLLWDGQRGM